MPRVIQFINRLNLGGPTSQVCFLVKYLVPEYEVLLISGMKDESEASSEFMADRLGLKPVYIKNMQRELSYSMDSKAYQEVKGIIQDFKPDIVHTHASKAGALGRLAAIKCGVPAIVHTFHGHVFHSYFNPVKTRIFLSIERYLGKRSDAIIAISESQRADLADVYKITDSNKIHNIPLGFELASFQSNIESNRKAFRQKYGIEDDAIAIGIIGRLVPVKNHRLFFQAIKLLSEQTSVPFKAVVVGDGESKLELFEFCKEINLSYCEPDNLNAEAPVIFTSWIKEIEVAYAGMDVIALSSLNEGTPVSLIEAQAASKPIVSTDVGGVKDVVLEGQTALLCDKDDINQFVEHLKLLVENSDKRKELSLKGYEFVKTIHGRERLVSDVKNLYQKLLIS